MTKLQRPAGWAVFAVLMLVFVVPHIPTSSGHFTFSEAFVVQGLIVGMTYGLLGVGLVLIYRTNRIINFAHGQIGAFGSAIFGLFVVKWHIPYWVAFLPALAITGGVGAASEAVVIRRLRKAPLVMSVVATLGLGQFLVLLGVLVDSSAAAGANYPEPAWLPSFHLGGLRVTPAYFATLVISPLIVAAIAVFLRVSRFGIGLRAAAANPEAARMAGISASRMSSLAWGIGGCVAAFTAIVTAPSSGGFTSGDSFGPSLLLRALVCAVVARMASMPIALAAGLGLGVVEELVKYNYGGVPGSTELTLFVIILLAMVFQRQRVGRAEEKGSWAAVQSIPPIPLALREVFVIRNLGRMTAAIVLAVLVLIPLGMSNSGAGELTGIVAYLIVGLSVGMVTGLGGQLSLGQFGIAAIGAVASYHTAFRSGDYVLSFLYAGLAAAAVSVAIGLPALRIKGLLLTVTTLSFGLMVPAWLLQRDWALGTSGVQPGRPVVFGQALTTSKQYYYFGLVILAFAFLIARNVRNGGIGRLLIAVRDNEDNARAFTIPAAMVKLQGFALAGFVAGIGGALFGHSLSLVNYQQFPIDTSTSVMVMAVIGGLGLLTGPMIGALLVFVVPTFVPNQSSLVLAATSLGQLLIIMYLPGGLGTLVGPLRDRVVKLLGARAGVDVEAAYLEESSSGAATSAAPARAAALPAFVVPAKPRRHGGAVLEASTLVKSFGGVRAVRGVSFEVARGETLGLIGPNGAGKTTTFELLAGFTKVDSGQVKLHGKDVTWFGPEARGRMGLIRSFQDAALFPTLTVLECVQLALEKSDRTQFASSLLGLPGQERRKEARARELVGWMGLDRYRSAQIQSLSTGTRRITEIACLVGLEPEVLLLDEPCAGVAQRETEALALLLQQLKAQLGLTLCIIEHDIPMIMSLSDRIVCMADGEVIAAGTPEIVRNDPRVVESYLGGSVTAIERSGTIKPQTIIKPPRPPRAPRAKKPVIAGSS